MDDAVLVPEVDKALVVIRNYVEILEKKVIELGTENKDLKIRLHDLHAQIRPSDERTGMHGYYEDGPPWSGGFIRRETSAIEERDQKREKEKMLERWTNMRIENL